MRTRSQDIANRLRDAILQGRYAPGWHLQELPLSDEMSVSRTPVRAALAALASEGLLDYVPKRGYFVRRFSLEEIEGAYEVRANLEGMACRLAAENGLRSDAAREIEAVLADGDAILARGHLREEDRQAWMDMNHRFHSLLLAAADRRLLTEIVEKTYRIPLLSSRVVHWYDYNMVRTSHDLHHRIFRYVLERRAVNAEALMREHVLQAIDQIRHRVETTVADLGADIALVSRDAA